MAAGGHEAFTWVSAIPGLKNIPYGHVSNAILIVLIIILISILGTRKIALTEEGAVPDDRLTFKNFCELLLEGILKIMEDSMGHHARKFLYLIGSAAIFILFSNISGLIPGFNPPTDNINTTAACAITVFLLYNYHGLKENGMAYLKHFAGPFWWLAPLMIPIEIIGHLARPLSLSLRLFGNIMGDHLVTAIFFSLVPIFVPVPIMVLGLFVCFVQTFVFCLLSMAYISGAIAHDEH
jgi:F-type H+-transporting ATPase subunit a